MMASSTPTAWEAPSHQGEGASQGEVAQRGEAAVGVLAAKKIATAAAMAGTTGTEEAVMMNPSCQACLRASRSGPTGSTTHQTLGLVLKKDEDLGGTSRG